MNRLTFRIIFHINNEAIRERLKAMYPEVAEATIREKIEGDTTFVEFWAKPGRKG